MKIAFVGVKRKYQELDPEYRDVFNKHHLELPYYYARDGQNWVTITTVDFNGEPLCFGESAEKDGALQCVTEDFFKSYLLNFGYDVVVHWRKWFQELYVPGAINVVNCQDHSFSNEWKADVSNAYARHQLRGILCFPGWHKRNLHVETGIPESDLFDGVTLGVDTDVYRPSLNKNPYKMLWASDPGRGLNGAVLLALELYRLDRRFSLDICYPDYVKGDFSVQHPAIRIHKNVKNGPDLWSLFNESGILPYTSTFKEPSSRAHRQAQAAGSLVLYPPGMGTPSELIESDVNGIVEPTNTWTKRIVELVESGKWKKIGEAARQLAVSENWHVQSQRFNLLMQKLITEKKQ